MDKFLGWLIAAPFIAILVFLLLIAIPILYVLGGMLSGWVVSWFWNDMIIAFLAQLGITGFPLYQVGGCLGFLTYFLKAGSYASATIKK